MNKKNYISLAKKSADIQINELKKIIELDNQNSKAFDLIGSELDNLNLTEEAKDRYLDSIYLDPDNSNPYYNLGNNLIMSGKLFLH